MKRSVPKPKKYTLHECKRELFLFAQSVKSIANRLEHDSKEYGVAFIKCYVEELRSKAENILERIQD